MHNFRVGDNTGVDFFLVAHVQTIDLRNADSRGSHANFRPTKTMQQN